MLLLLQRSAALLLARPCIHGSAPAPGLLCCSQPVALLHVWAHLGGVRAPGLAHKLSMWRLLSLRLLVTRVLLLRCRLVALRACHGGPKGAQGIGHQRHAAALRPRHQDVTASLAIVGPCRKWGSGCTCARRRDMPGRLAEVHLLLRRCTPLLRGHHGPLRRLCMLLVPPRSSRVPLTSRHATAAAGLACCHLACCSCCYLGCLPPGAELVREARQTRCAARRLCLGWNFFGLVRIWFGFYKPCFLCAQQSTLMLPQRAWNQ